MHFCRGINFACNWQDLKEDLVQDMVACLSNQLKIRCIHELPAHLLRQKLHVAYNNRRSQQMLACASPSKRRLRHKQQHRNNETYVYTHSINGCCHPPPHPPQHTHTQTQSGHTSTCRLHLIFLNIPWCTYFRYEEILQYIKR